MPQQYGSLREEIDAKYSKARATGCWFWHKQFHHWKTPEEFKIEVDTHYWFYGERDRIIVDSYGLGDPLDDLKTRMAAVRKATIELEEFSKQLFDYFNLEAKERLSK